MRLDWLSVKELNLSYHNGYMRTYMYIHIGYMGYVGYLGFRVTIMGICSNKYGVPNIATLDSNPVKSFTATLTPARLFFCKKSCIILS